MQGVEELQEGLPLAGLDGLPSIISETEVHRSGTVEGIEDLVDGLGGERAVGRVAWNIGFIDLQAGTRTTGDLSGKDVRECEGQGCEVMVVLVEESAGQHVGACDSELEGAAGEIGRTLAVVDQVESATVQRFAHHSGGLGAEAHALVGVKGFCFGPADGGIAATHGRDEVLDHTVGIRVIDVEAVEFPVGGQVDPGLALGVEDDPGGIGDGLFGGESVQPVGHGIGSDRGCQDAWPVGKGRDRVHERTWVIRCGGSFKSRV